MINRSVGLARLRCMADTVQPRLQPSCMRLSPGNGWVGTPMPRKKRSTSSPAPANCTWPASSTIVYEIEPGKRLGWHTVATEETQYIIAGTGELHMEDGTTHQVGPGSVFAIPTPVKHDLVNVGKETLRAVAFFAAAMFTQNFDNVMLPPKSHILGTPNREG